MSLLPLFLLFVPQAVEPPAKPVRALAIYDVHQTPADESTRLAVGVSSGSRAMAPSEGRRGPMSRASKPSEEVQPFDVSSLYVLHGTELSTSAGIDAEPVPLARLLAALIEEQASAFDPTVRCHPRGTTVAVESAAQHESRVRDLFEATCAASRDCLVRLEMRFLVAGPEAVRALERSGIGCAPLEGAAVVQEAKLSVDEITAALKEDGDVILLPKLAVGSGQQFDATTNDPVSVVTGWTAVPIAELGMVLSPKIATLEEGLSLSGAALVLPRSAEKGGDRFVFDLEIAASAIKHPIGQARQVIDGKEVILQQPAVKRSSLHALFTFGAGQRVIVAGLARPGFDGTLPQPILLEVTATRKAASEPQATPVKEK